MRKRHRENVASNAITIKDREAERKAESEAVTNNHRFNYCKPARLLPTTVQIHGLQCASYPFCASSEAAARHVWSERLAWRCTPPLALDSERGCWTCWPATLKWSLALRSTGLTLSFSVRK